MPNATVTVLEADGTTQTDVVVLDVGRQAAAASKSTALATEDKAVLDAIAAALALLDNAVAGNEFQVDVLTMPTVAVTGTFWQATQPVSLASVPSHAVTNAGTFAVQSTIAAAIPAGTNNIGDVDVLTLPAIPAGANHIGQVGGNTAVRNLTLSLDTAVYAAGDVLAATQQLDGAFRITNGSGLLQSITIIDKDDQGVDFSIYILDANVAIGTENAAASISDVNAENILGIIDVAAADYKDLGGVRVAQLKNIGLPIKAVTGTDDLYVAVVNGAGTPTYTASGVVLRFGILLD